MNVIPEAQRDVAAQLADCWRAYSLLMPEQDGGLWRIHAERYSGKREAAIQAGVSETLLPPLVNA